MNRKTAPRRRKDRIKPTLIASFLVFLSIPVVLFGLTQIQNTDTRSSAQVVTTPNCTITFLYVDPSSLEVNKAVSLQVDGSVPSQNINSVTINSTLSGQAATQIFTRTYATPAATIRENFRFTPTQLGQYSISGTVQATNSAGAVNNYQCLLANGGAANAMVVPQNALPTFITQPPTNQNNNLQVGDTYQHTLQAQDTDSSTSFGYSYSFTPRAPWLRATITREAINNVPAQD